MTSETTSKDLNIDEAEDLFKKIKYDEVTCLREELDVIWDFLRLAFQTGGSLVEVTGHRGDAHKDMILAALRRAPLEMGQQVDDDYRLSVAGKDFVKKELTEQLHVLEQAVMNDAVTPWQAQRMMGNLFVETMLMATVDPNLWAECKHPQLALDFGPRTPDWWYVECRKTKEQVFDEIAYAQSGPEAMPLADVVSDEASKTMFISHINELAHNLATTQRAVPSSVTFAAARALGIRGVDLSNEVSRRSRFMRSE